MRLCPFNSSHWARKHLTVSSLFAVEEEVVEEEVVEEELLEEGGRGRGRGETFLQHTGTLWGYEL